MIPVQRPEEAPVTLAERGRAVRAELEAAYEQGERQFEFERAIYAANDVKGTLVAMQHDKCAFCEAKITHVAYGDVEHFRPQGCLDAGRR